MKPNDRDIPGEAEAGRRWHNRLPPWITVDLVERKLRQGPCATLQAIADGCTALPLDEAGEVIGPLALLVCFGGKGLIARCGCHVATFRRHKNELTRRGFIVRLSGGSSRLADVYGIPGHRGELDPYSAERGERLGTGPGGRWERDDTKQLRLLLVSHNATLAGDAAANAEPSQNATPGVAKRAARGSKTRALGVQNATLSSSLSSSCNSAHITSSSRRKKARALQDDDDGSPSSTRNTIDGLLPKVEQLPIKAETRPRPPGTNPVFRKLALKLPDGAGADEVQVVLRSNGVDPGRAYKLAHNRYVTPAMIRHVLGRVIPNLSTIENPGGYIGNLVDDEIAKAREAERQSEAQAFEADQQRLAEAEAAIDTMPDDELQEVIKSIGVLKDLSPAAVRADRVFRVEVARRMSSKRELDVAPVAGVPT